MMLDARTVPQGQNIESDICIIGAGAAGITIAREFRQLSIKVCLLESGGLEYESETQSLYDGEVVNDRYFPLNISRLRYFGGTTNHWEGACIPLNKIDFEFREWVAHSGWPFDLDEIIPFYRHAQDICEIGPFNYTAEYWESKDTPSVKLASNRLHNTIYQISPPTRFGQVYKGDVTRAPNIDTYLYANVTDIESNDTASTVKKIRVTTLNKNYFWVKSRIYILATGGLENPRLLLNANSTQKNGLGNQNDLVGRYFLEHPITVSGLILPTNFDYRFYGYPKVSYQDDNRMVSMKISGYITPSEETMRKEKLMNCGIGFSKKNWEDISEGVASMKEILEDLSNGEFPDDLLENMGNVIADIDDVALATYRKFADEQRDLLQVNYWAEQSPNPDSRVSLIAEKDALGQNRVKLDWRLNEQDRMNINRVHEILAEELGRASLGRLRFDFDSDAENWSTSFRGSFHHMGTTRMHNNPKQGVVDADCRVHGIENLYIAGSSVFPTCGHANPTLTIVALSLRLATHIKGVVT